MKLESEKHNRNLPKPFHQQSSIDTHQVADHEKLQNHSQLIWPEGFSVYHQPIVNNL